MSVVTALSTATLKELRQNHHQNQDLPFISERAIIRLIELERFIREAKENHGAEFSGVQIHFVRYKKDENSDQSVIRTAKNGLSQVSLVLTASKILSAKPDWRAEDLEKEGELTTLTICDPEIDNETGICPPTCEPVGVGKG